MTRFTLRADREDGRLCGARCEGLTGLWCSCYRVRLDVTWRGIMAPMRARECVERHGYKTDLLAEHKTTRATPD